MVGEGLGLANHALCLHLSILLSSTNEFYFGCLVTKTKGKVLEEKCVAFYWTSSCSETIWWSLWAGWHLAQWNQGRCKRGDHLAVTSLAFMLDESLHPPGLPSWLRWRTELMRGLCSLSLCQEERWAQEKPELPGRKIEKWLKVTFYLFLLTKCVSSTLSLVPLVSLVCIFSPVPLSSQVLTVLMFLFPPPSIKTFSQVFPTHINFISY